MYCTRFSAVWPRSLLMLLIGSLLAACAQQQIQFQSNGFNRAIEQTTNELLLLNIVRSSKDLPIYFTKLTAFTGGNMLSGTVQPKLPFGPSAVSSYDLGLTTSWSSGVSTMQFADLNQHEGLHGLRTPIEFYVFDRYANDSFPWWVLATLMIESFEVSEQINTALLKKQQSFCDTNKTSDVCEYITHIQDRCGRDSWVAKGAVHFYKTKFGSFVGHHNRGRSECEYLRFQSFIAVLAISGFAIDTLPTEDKSKAKDGKRKGKGKGRSEEDDDEEARLKQKPKPSTEVRFLRNPAADEFLTQADKELEAYFKARRPDVIPKSGLNPTMRSPKRMIEFLGELTASQNYAEKTFQPMVLLPVAGRGRQAPFFKVERGEERSRGAALVVRDPHGEIFSIPAPQLGAPTRDQSLVVLSIVNDLVNASTSKGSYPTPSIVEFRSVN